MDVFKEILNFSIVDFADVFLVALTSLLFLQIT